MAGGDPAAGGMPVMLSIDDLRAVLAEAGGGGGAEGASPEEQSKRVTNKDIGERLEQVEMMLAHMANFMGVPLPEGDLMPTKQAEVPPAQEEAGGMPISEPAAATISGPGAGMPDPSGGLLPGAPSDAGMFPPASVKTASAISDEAGSLLANLRKLNSYQ